MIKWLIRIIWGDNCEHNWEAEYITEHENYVMHLYVCKKCGRFKIIRT